MLTIRGQSSEFNSSDRGSKEHDSAYDATKSLVDHLGSNDGQTFQTSHAWLSREPGSWEYKPFVVSDGVAIERNLVPQALSAVAETEKLFFAPSWPERKGPTSSRQRTTRIKPLCKAPSTHSAKGTRGGRRQKFREQQRRKGGIRGSRSCLAATRTCSGARTGKDG